MKVSVYLEITKNCLEKCENMKPVHIAQVSFHILHIFAQVLYFAHFSRRNVLAKAFWCKPFTKYK